MRRHRCSYCGKEGHNKATCPTWRKDREDRAPERDSAWSNPVRVKKERKPPTCSCCGYKGHTKRKCPKVLQSHTTGQRILPGSMVIRDYCEVMLVLRTYVVYEQLYVELVSMDYAYAYRTNSDEQRERGCARHGKIFKYTTAGYSFEDASEFNHLEQLYEWCWRPRKKSKFS